MECTKPTKTSYVEQWERVVLGGLRPNDLSCRIVVNPNGTYSIFKAKKAV